MQNNLNSWTSNCTEHWENHRINKCIGHDTKATARQSPNCIKINKIKYGEKRFSIWRMEFLHPAMWHDYDTDFARWLRNHGSEFTKWQHPAMWYVALGWHATEFAQTSAILEFYIWFRFRPYHHSQHVILHQSLKFYPNRTTLGRKKWHHVDFQDGGTQPSWILWIQ